MSNFLKVTGGFSMSYLATVSALVLGVGASPNWTCWILGMAVWSNMVIGHYTLRGWL